MRKSTSKIFFHQLQEYFLARCVLIINNNSLAHKNIITKKSIHLEIGDITMPGILGFAFTRKTFSGYSLIHIQLLEQARELLSSNSSVSDDQYE